MTTTQPLPSKANESTFSYAAAASGKPPSKPTMANAAPVQNPNQEHSVVNGVGGEISSSQSAEIGTVTETLATPIVAGTSANGDSVHVSSAAQKPLNEEKGASAGKTLPEGGVPLESTKEGARTPEVVKDKLVPAPPPPVNVWTLRAKEYNTAKAKLQTVASPPNPVPKQATLVAPNVAEKVVETKPADKRRPGNRQEGGSWESDRTRDSVAQDRRDSVKDGRDKKKSTDTGRTNGYPAREDGNMRGPKAHRHGHKPNPEKETAAPELPPPLADTTSWPTPEIAQDEEKKERERLQREEKDIQKSAVTRTSGPTKFVPAPFTPTIVHNVPLPTKGGRGGRNARGGGRGGSTIPTSGEVKPERVDRAEKPVNLPETERGRVNSRGASYNGRGNYHGNSRGGRRTGSSGSNAIRKDTSPAVSSEGTGGEQNTKQREENPVQTNGRRSPSSIQVQAEPRRRDSRDTQQKPIDDGAFVGQGVIPLQFPERPDRTHTHSLSGPNGSGYQSSNDTPSYTQGRPERGSMSGRGGYRGARGHFGSQHHGTPSHANSMAGPTFHNVAFPQQTQPYPRYNRGNSRGHPTPGRGFHPAYQPAIFTAQPFAIPAYAYYDYTAIMPPPEEVTTKDTYAELLKPITKQLEYYFSVDNLCKDLFLRKHMDSEGFVSMSLVAGFSMMRRLTSNLDMVRDACLASQTLEVMQVPEGYRLRRRTGYESFILNPEERDPSVLDRNPPSTGQGNGSAKPQMSAAAPVFQPTLQQSHDNVATPVRPAELLPEGHTSNQTGQSANVQPAAAAVAVVDTADDIQRSNSQLSADAVEFSPVTNGYALAAPSTPPPESAEFPDEEIEQVNIIYKRSLLDNSTTCPEDFPARVNANGELLSPLPAHQTRLNNLGLSWTIGQSEESSIYTFVEEKYTALRNTALQKRLEGSPASGKMTILYRFWKHFLTNNFNRKMYNEFRALAVEDAQATEGMSLVILFGFYEALHLKGNPGEDVSRDFVYLAEQSCDEGVTVGIITLKNVLEAPGAKDEVKAVLKCFAGEKLKGHLV